VAFAFGLTDKGRIRKTNEDVFLCDQELQLFLVADGMGGHNAGEIASRLAVDAVAGFLRRSADAEEFSWPYGIDPHLSLDGNRMRTAIYLANRRVFRAAESHDDYVGMGTTLVGALLGPSRLIVGHVGDSRLYLHRKDELRRLTTDDSWVATILAHEVADTAALAQHPLRNVLTNVLGAREPTDIHLSEQPIEGDERLLLCTDGLHGALEDARIEQLMMSSDDPEVVAHALVDAALDAGSRDNVTALVVHCGVTA
jgi:PPM family protein phosphatase